ncbi:MAG TPA: flagellar hook-associated protein FlgK [Alphaproteobacteria bacterium]|nr:flagellar hook-associated protein FlgK [Alphaproteobacteria bacterium]
MADLFGSGVSGLLAYQRAIATTGHNISNVNTDGYSRQQVEMSTRIPQPSGAGYIGSGVKVDNVRRMYDQFVTEQVQNHTSQDGYLNKFYDLASQVDNLLADPDAGLDPAVQDFFNSINGLADNPSSTSARQVVLSQAESLTERFHSVDGRLASLEDSANTRLENIVGEINALADSIAEVNKNIGLARDLAGGSPPNDLLDQRDELLRRLSEYVPVSTVEQEDGAVNVFVGNGQTLVLNDDAQGLGTTRNAFDASRLEITAGRSGDGPVISDQLKGGEIAGVLDFRSEVLDPTRNKLGRIAVGIAQSMNDQHQLGMDLNNELGDDFFTVAGLSTPSRALDHSANDGSTTVTYQVNDASSLTESDYRLEYLGGNQYELTRLSDSTVLDTFTLGGGGYPDTYTSSEGFTITADSAPQTRDRFLIQPTRTGAEDIEPAVDNVKDIAAALPIRGEKDVGNLGNAELGNLAVGAGTDLPTVFAEGPVTLTFDAAANEFDVTTASGPSGTLAYDPSTVSSADFDLGTALGADYADIGLTISGTPLDGDTFTISKNADAVSDNRNALELAGLQETGILENQSTTFQSAYGQMVSEVGTRTHQLDINSEAQKTLLKQAEATREGISGVNLDEEAANLSRFQQAYQASAQVINAAQSMFDTLLNAVR